MYFFWLMLLGETALAGGDKDLILENLLQPGLGGAREDAQGVGHILLVDRRAGGNHFIKLLQGAFGDLQGVGFPLDHQLRAPDADLYVHGLFDQGQVAVEVAVELAGGLIVGEFQLQIGQGLHTPGKLEERSGRSAHINLLPVLPQLLVDHRLDARQERSAPGSRR